jgi:hypothetical protein
MQYEKAFTMSKLAIHKKKHYKPKKQIQLRMKPWKFWNESVNVKIIGNGKKILKETCH